VASLKRSPVPRQTQRASHTSIFGGTGRNETGGAARLKEFPFYFSDSIFLTLISFN
jgi:hypothetical protein